MRTVRVYDVRLVVGAILIPLTVFLGYGASRSDFASYSLAFGAFFTIYAWFLFRYPASADEQRWFIGLGVLLRAVLLFSLPNLSDDFYRFLWDGRLAAQGIHPFAHPPVFFMLNPAHLVGITPELFQKLNSPEYYTVYPPVCQGVFWLAAKIFPTSTLGGVFILKLFLFACELGTLAMLVLFSNKENGTAQKAAVAYALNPLAILEITGNCHFEGAMLCFLLAGLVALQGRHLLWGALFWALAVASKLVPLLFLPIVFVWLGWRAGLRFLGYFTLFCAALFLPLLNLEILANMAGSLNLYFRQFAFNASGYYLLKAIGKAIAPPTLDVGRTLGPILGATVFVGVLVIAFFRKKKREVSLAEKCLLASTLYLALSTTVHPWYILLPLGLGLLTPWRFPLVWTAAAALSYSHYVGGGFRENYTLIALEYTLVAIAAVWEFRKL
ncbi:MAG: hypothetical protein ACKVU2_04485 [Saprospiraceae bacterium]